MTFQWLNSWLILLLQDSVIHMDIMDMEIQQALPLETGAV